MCISRDVVVEGGTGVDMIVFFLILLLLSSQDRIAA
jgi:hypothetical protein